MRMRPILIGQGTRRRRPHAIFNRPARKRIALHSAAGPMRMGGGSSWEPLKLVILSGGSSRRIHPHGVLMHEDGILMHEDRILIESSRRILMFAFP